MAVRGTASRGPRTQALGRPKALGSRRSGRLGEPSGQGGGRRETLPMPRIARGFPPTRRIARPISMGHYQRDLVSGTGPGPVSEPMVTSSL